MREKMKSILDYMVRKESVFGIKNYRDAGEHIFELKTHYSDYGHRTLLRYEPNNSMDMFRVEVRHIFASINLPVDPTTAASQLLTMLGHNVGSWLDSTAYLGIGTSDNDECYAVLNSFQHFMMKWNDEDIAEALHLLFFDMTTGLTMNDNSLTMMKEFSEE